MDAKMTISFPHTSHHLSDYWRTEVIIITFICCGGGGLRIGTWRQGFLIEINREEKARITPLSHSPTHITCNSCYQIVI